MTITPALYKDVPALSLGTNRLTALLLPDHGGKLASLRLGARELLWQRPDERVRPLTLDGSYADAECAGFDDCFPTVDPCVLGKRVYLDHGEVCRRPCETDAPGDGTLHTRCRCECVPADFERVFSERDGALRVDYRVVNRSGEPLPFLWLAHFMLWAEPGGRAVVPYPDGAETELCFSERADAAPGDRLQYPYWPDGTRLDTSGPVPGSSWKYYFTDPLPGDRVGYRWPDGTALTLGFDPDKTPWVGLWYCEGAPLPCVGFAPELATSPFDRPDAAAARGHGRELPPYGEFTFHLTIDAR